MIIDLLKLIGLLLLISIAWALAINELQK